MGRRPNAAKNVEKSYTPENTNPSLEREGSPVNISGVELPPERTMEINRERSPIKERSNSPCEVQQKSAKSGRKNSKYNKAAVRRSQRIQNAVTHAPNVDIEPVVEQITLNENNRDEAATHEEDEVVPGANTHGKSLEEKVGVILQQLEAQEKTIEAFQFKVDENSSLDESSSAASIKYRSMYIDSQKKIDALKDENRQLIAKLENALGKVEVFEKQYRYPIEVLEKMKEVAVHVSNEAIRNAFSLDNVLELRVPAAKRKKHAQENGKDPK
ncbi:titin-like isoform X2 [Quillaja saponaria]|uniref:Titin-like isoform X2 n=1 Tax=Quillaja saponaria TaxID=32244 RepID=A0AAD7VIX8_QUISA|nr:titin-like isoform X2 [Quillaja saponaria]